MSETYSVVMTGRIADGMELGQVKANVAKLFKLGDEQLEKLFSGKPVAVRRGVDRQQADKICAALTKAGAVAAVKSNRPLAPVEAPAAVQAKPSEQAEPAAKAEPAVKPVPATTAATAASDEAVAPSEEGLPAELDCPRCGHHQPLAKACSLCKMDLTLHLQRVKRREQVRALRRQASS